MCKLLNLFRTKIHLAHFHRMRASIPHRPLVFDWRNHRNGAGSDSPDVWQSKINWHRLRSLGFRCYRRNYSNYCLRTSVASAIAHCPNTTMRPHSNYFQHLHRRHWCRMVLLPILSIRSKSFSKMAIRIYSAMLLSYLNRTNLREFVCVGWRWCDGERWCANGKTKHSKMICFCSWV